MLDRIAEISRTTAFDIRDYVYPLDPLRHLFDEWVGYYRTKYAICSVLQPRSIVEIGVRYGYSAVAFLSACPEAAYTGIDNNSATYGGAVDAIAWARRITADRRAEFILADTQQLRALPGAYYDLAHVDGQQDGDGTFHDMELALEKAQWILVDGYFWSRENMLSATFFLEKYRSLVEGAYIIPGYAGDLLVRTKTRPDRKVFRDRASDHRSLRDAYDTPYFLQDCGGHAGFKAWGGKRLTDPRLIALYHLGRPRHGMRVLDVGCGRGELAYACFEAGADVTGVDYAASAIAICRQTYGAQCGERLRFVETDILQFEPSAQFDLILASDFVEHIVADALDAVLARIAQLLAPGGRLVVHTWPNRLAYDYQYKGRRRQVLRGGGYLPRNQRTYYEDLMHVNEQTPAGLRRALCRSFPFARVWVGSGKDPLGLATKDAPMRSQLRQHESLFAVASTVAMSMSEVEQSLWQQPLNPAGLTGVRIVGASAPETMRCGETTCGSVEVANMSTHSLRSFPPYPVRLSYHWYRDGALALRDGLRSELMPALEAESTNAYAISIQSPLEAGQYELALTLVQEGCFWFDDALPSCIFRQFVDVT